MVMALCYKDSSPAAPNKNQERSHEGEPEPPLPRPARPGVEALLKKILKKPGSGFGVHKWGDVI